MKSGAKKKENDTPVYEEFPLTQLLCGKIEQGLYLADSPSRLEMFHRFELGLVVIFRVVKTNNL